MSDVMMAALQAQVESLTRQVKQLGPENQRVRKLLTEFAARHDADKNRIERQNLDIEMLRDALQNMRRQFSPYPSEDTERWREEHEACQSADAALAALLEVKE
jgi:septal ring factor EnvC (AmiA/AmiB activator)